MRVGVVQIDSSFGEVSQNIEKTLRRISSQNADLWVLPELFNSGYQFTSKKEVKELAEPIPSGPTTQALIETAKRLKTTIVAGLPESDGQKCYNTSILIGPRGWIASYRKIHLFYEEKRWFTPGDRPFQVYSVGYKSPKGGQLKCQVGMMICFDWVFPESARTLTLLGADILCHPANLVLPHCPQAMITRCLENRVFAVTANRIGSESRGEKTLKFIGQSQVVDPGGEILYRASSHKEAVHVVTIDPKQARNKSINRYNHLLEDRVTRFYNEDSTHR